MQTLTALQFFSGTLPGGETVTLHTGNARAFDDADAAWLLAEYPDRFVAMADAPVVSADNPKRARAAGPDPSLESKPVEVPDDVEKFGANARRKRGN